MAIWATQFRKKNSAPRSLFNVNLFIYSYHNGNTRKGWPIGVHTNYSYTARNMYSYVCGGLFNDAIYCWDCIASVIYEWIGLEHWWNNTDGKILSQCHTVHHKSHMDWFDVEPESPLWGRRLTPIANSILIIDNFCVNSFHLLLNSVHFLIFSFEINVKFLKLLVIFLISSLFFNNNGAISLPNL